jgi:hypothetical protein
MNTHKNAHLTPKDRDAMVRAFVAGGLTKAVAPRQCHTMPKTIGNGSIASSRSGSRANAGLLLLQQTTPRWRKKNRRGVHGLPEDVASIR